MSKKKKKNDEWTFEKTAETERSNQTLTMKQTVCVSKNMMTKWVTKLEVNDERL